ncbi:MAG TPA: GNAT family N-acetyltransferase [Thermoanaerobaculia bacterium]|nr:GNAT family N-acetyltransferase [Thermoanaerobaculia bacterium]
MATMDDVPALAELGARTFRDAFAAQNTADNLNAYIARTYGGDHQRRELDDPSIATFVVEQDGALIAFAQCRRGNDDVELARLYVDRRFHGKGIAQELMDAVVAFAHNAGVGRLWLGVWEHNPRAIAFYEKCGFRVTGSHPFIVGSDVQTDLVMERPL